MFRDYVQVVGICATMFTTTICILALSNPSFTHETVSKIHKHEMKLNSVCEKVQKGYKGEPGKPKATIEENINEIKNNLYDLNKKVNNLVFHLKPDNKTDLDFM